MASAAVTEPSEPFRFLDLPLELQRRVLECYYEGSWSVKVEEDDENHYHYVFEPDITALFLVSKHLKTESEQVFSAVNQSNASGILKLLNHYNSFPTKWTSENLWFRNYIAIIVFCDLDLITKMDLSEIFPNVKRLVMDGDKIGLSSNVRNLDLAREKLDCRPFLSLTCSFLRVMSNMTYDLPSIDRFIRGKDDEYTKKAVVSDVLCKLYADTWRQMSHARIDPAMKNPLKGLVLTHRVESEITVELHDRLTKHFNCTDLILYMDLEITDSDGKIACKISKRWIETRNITWKSRPGYLGPDSFPENRTIDTFEIDEFCEILKTIG